MMSTPKFVVPTTNDWKKYNDQRLGLLLKKKAMPFSFLCIDLGGRRVTIRNVSTLDKLEQESCRFVCKRGGSSFFSRTKPFNSLVPQEKEWKILKILFVVDNPVEHELLFCFLFLTKSQKQQRHNCHPPLFTNIWQKNTRYTYTYNLKGYFMTFGRERTQSSQSAFEESV